MQSILGIDGEADEKTIFDALQSLSDWVDALSEISVEGLEAVETLLP